MEHIKNFKAACKKTGDNPTALPVAPNPEYQEALESFYKLLIMTRAENDDVKPDYTNMSERKYEPIFVVEANEKNKSGVGLSYYGCDYGHSRTDVGARLNFRKEESAEYAAKNWPEYKGLMTWPENKVAKKATPVKKAKVAPKKAVAKKTASKKK